MDTVEWIDLSSYKYEILLASFEEATDVSAILLRGNASLDSNQENALMDAGFRLLQEKPSVWGRKGNSYTLSEMRAVFPELSIRSMERKEFHVSVQGITSLVDAEFAEVSTEQTKTTTHAPKVEAPSHFGPQKINKNAEISLPVVNDLDDGILDGEVEKINLFQARYRPKSGIGEATATVPFNLALAIQAALNRLEEEKGDIDLWVMRELDWTRDQLERYLAPEQIDAVALGIRAAQSGKGFIIADQTGFGKGRVMASLLRWSALHYGRAVFLTEKANLFTDIWRDIKDIESEDIFGTPIMMNGNATIIDQATGETLFKSPKKKELDQMLSSKTTPPSSSLILATYTQFNRKNSAKAKFLSHIVSDGHLFLDECHNMVNDSNTRSNLFEALESARGTTFSSATFARNAMNMGTYRSVFPPSISSLDLVDVLRSGGPHMLESLSQSLAEEGLLIRREHDLSNISINVVTDEKRAEEHKTISDYASPILARMARLADEVEKLAEDMELTKNHKGERYYVANFGIRLSAIVKQLLTALSVDLCVDMCADALKNGKKPVIVLENTMESLMREIAMDDDRIPLSGDGPDKETDIPPPSFKDALSLMLERIMQVSRKETGQNPERLPVDRSDLVAEANSLKSEIERFPDLSLSPIDDIRERVEEIGREYRSKGVVDKSWNMGEISARSLRVENGTYQAMENADRNKTIASFNSGKLDGLVLTRAASTGLSLHDSERANDNRQRVMIELQIPVNVVDRVQFWGRVNRRGQRSVPEFHCLSTVLPYQVRVLANQNSKVAELSANVSGSTKTALTMDIPDIINPVGNDVAKRLLDSNPKIARRLGIAMRVDPDQAAAEYYYVNKLLSRLVLLPSEYQEIVYDRLLTSYKDISRELAAKGQTPGQVRQMEGTWTTQTRHLFDAGMPEDGAVFGRPVYLTTLSRERHAHPIKGDDLKRYIEGVRQKHQENFQSYSAPELSKSHLQYIEDNRVDLLQRALPSHYSTVRDALSARDDNAVNRLAKRLDALNNALNRLETGLLIHMTGEDGEFTPAMILDVIHPEVNRSHIPSSYNLRYILPGDEKPREMSLSALLRDASLHYGSKPPADLNKLYAKPFEEAPSGKTVETRRILDGNLFSAVRAAKAAKIGSLVEFNDDHGRLRRGVLIPRNKQDNIHQLPGSTRSPSVIRSILSNGGGPVYTNPDNLTEGVLLSRDGSKLMVTVPGKKRAAKAVVKQELINICGTFDGDWRGKSSHVDPDKLDDIINILISDGHSFHYAGKWRQDALKSIQLSCEEAHRECENASLNLV